MDERELRFLKRVFSEVIEGFTRAEFRNKPIVLKHLTQSDQVQIDTAYDRYYDVAVHKGFPTEADRLAYLKAQKQWTAKDESIIRDFESMIAGLTRTKGLMPLQSQIDQISKQIADEQVKLAQKRAERTELIGITVESFAQKKLTDLYIYNSIYSDTTFTNKPFTFAEFDELDEDEFRALDQTYFKGIEKFGTKNLKKICITPFFQNIFGLCQDPMDFLGMPAIKLSFYQTELLIYGGIYKSILDDGTKPPPDIADDPDKIMDWKRGAQNLQKTLESGAKEGAATTLFGATKRDLQTVGVKPIVKTPKKMDMQEMIKLHKA